MYSIQKLWVPQSSQIYKDFMLQEQYFGSYPSSLVLMFEGYDNGNIMTPNGLTQAYQAMNTINNITAMSDNEQYTFSDVCAKIDITSIECMARNVNLHAIYFENNEAYWTDQDYIDAVLNRQRLEFFAGGLQYNDAGETIIGANVIRVYYELVSASDQEFNQAIIEYQRAFVEYWKLHKSDYSEFKVRFITTHSFNDELSRNSSENLKLMVIAFLVMLAYLQLILGRFTCVHSRALLATSSVKIIS